MEKSELRLDMRRLNKILAIMIDMMEKMEDDGRDIPIMWNKMHMFSSSQLAKVVAIKRGLDPEIAGITAALHDMGTIISKKRENHAVVGAPMVREFLQKFNEEHGDSRGVVTSDEIEIIVHAVENHSSKEEVSVMPYSELMKDVDSLDRYLHGIPTKGHHIDRYSKIALEIGIEE